MKNRTSLSTFRAFARQQESMIRAAMPKTSAADPEPLAAFASPTVREVVAAMSGTRLVRPTFTIAEVARVA